MLFLGFEISSWYIGRDHTPSTLDVLVCNQLKMCNLETSFSITIPEDLNLVPDTYFGWLTSTFNSRSRESSAPHLYEYLHNTHTQTHTVLIK